MNQVETSSSPLPGVACSECGRRFKRACHLARHMQTHSKGVAVGGKKSSVEKDWKKLVRDLPKGDGLVSMEKFGKRRASIRDIVEWVARNLIVEDVDIESCPDPTAWGLLCYTRQGKAQEKTFWGIWAQFLPTRGQVEREAQLTDGGRDPLDLVEQFMLEGSWRDDQAVVVGNGRLV